MRSSWREADRAAEVRDAARGWRAAGIIDGTATDAIAADWPLPGPSLGWAWRILVFVCVVAGASAAVALLFMALDLREEGSIAAALLAAGAALALLTEGILARSRFRPTGAEAATSLLAVLFVVAAALMLGEYLDLRGAAAPRLVLTSAAAALALAAWRWGFRLYAGAATLAALLLAAQFAAPRTALTATAALIALGVTAALARLDLAPSHRGALELARAVALAGVYFALNYLSVDKGFVEEIARDHHLPAYRAGQGALMLALAGSALVPALLLAWGLRARNRLLVAIGVVAAALSLATIRFYVQVAPLWFVLAAAGAALAGAALLLERWLRSGPQGERGGFTAVPLHDESQRQRLLPVAAALASAPEARTLPDEPRGLQGGGGASGGAGASGGF